MAGSPKEFELPVKPLILVEVPESDGTAASVASDSLHSMEAGSEDEGPLGTDALIQKEQGSELANVSEGETSSVGDASSLEQHDFLADTSEFLIGKTSLLEASDIADSIMGEFSVPIAHTSTSHPTETASSCHLPNSLPQFSDPRSCMWTSSHAANRPSEDRNASLTNVVLRPRKTSEDSPEADASDEPEDFSSLIRLNMWSVIDGHGGGSVAAYASEVLLPHMMATIARALDCTIVSSGVSFVNGQRRDINEIDLDGLIQSSDRRSAHPNSIRYRAPQESDNDDETNSSLEQEDCSTRSTGAQPSETGTAAAASQGDRTESSVPAEVSTVTGAITESFLAVDEGWINSIDPLTTRQDSCQFNGRWNSGACALIALTTQRLEWTQASIHREGSTSLPSSLKTVPKESPRDSIGGEPKAPQSGLPNLKYPRDSKTPSISIWGACDCHGYHAHDALLYTAHVGDCRAVLLGSVPQQTVETPDDVSGIAETITEESCDSSSDETSSCLSSPRFNLGSRRMDPPSKFAKAPVSVVHRPARRLARRRVKSTMGGVMQRSMISATRGRNRPLNKRRYSDTQSSGSSESADELDCKPIDLCPVARPIELTIDHSAYNPAEVSAVVKRCHNAPSAIAPGIAGGINRVAGSLSVTRALGDAYLKTPLLSFTPYKQHAPYITAKPEVSCRVVNREDKVLILATDGVWERASGDDILKWVRSCKGGHRHDSARSQARRSTSTSSHECPTDECSACSDSTCDDLDSGARNDTKSQGLGPPSKRLKTDRWDLSLPGSKTMPLPERKETLADVIVRRVLNRVRRSRNIATLDELMSLRPGRERRSIHDDITTTVVELPKFIC